MGFNQLSMSIIQMKMLETPATQYDSFLYWRQPIPELDLSELQDLGVAKVVPIQKNKTKKKKKSPLKIQVNITSYSYQSLCLAV